MPQVDFNYLGRFTTDPRAMPGAGWVPVDAGPGAAGRRELPPTVAVDINAAVTDTGTAGGVLVPVRGPHHRRGE
jgi:hypothetical protein